MPDDIVTVETELPNLPTRNAGASDRTPLLITIPRIQSDEIATKKLSFRKKVDVFYAGASLQLMLLLAYLAAKHVFINRHDSLFLGISTPISSIAAMLTAMRIATDAHMWKHNIDDFRLEENLKKFNNLMKSGIDIPNQFYIFYQLLANIFETSGSDDNSNSANDIYFHFLLVFAFMYALGTFKPINDRINRVSKQFLSANKHFIFNETRYWFNQLLKFYTITGVPTTQMIRIIRLLFSKDNGMLIENFITQNAKSIFGARLILSTGVAALLTNMHAKEQRQHENSLIPKSKKYVKLLNHMEMSLLVTILLAEAILAAIEQRWMVLTLYATLFLVMELLYLSLNNYTCQEMAFNITKAVTISIGKSSNKAGTISVGKSPNNAWNEQLTESFKSETTTSITKSIPQISKIEMVI